jgi:hypothetical protein
VIIDFLYLIMNNRITSSFFILTLLVIAIQSCEDDKLPAPGAIDCDGFKTVSFDVDIQPIINSNCAIVGDGGCHNGGNGPTLTGESLVISKATLHKLRIVFSALSLQTGICRRSVR